MKQMIFMAMVVVSSMSHGGPVSTAVTHGTDLQTSSLVGKSQTVKTDKAAKLKEIVNSCTVGQGNAKSNSNLGRSSK